MRLTEETLNTLCDAIVKGHAVRFACAFAGISETSYVRWRLRGLDILEERDEGKEPEIADEEAYLNFYLQTEKAHAGFSEFCRDSNKTEFVKIRLREYDGEHLLRDPDDDCDS